MGVEPTEVRTDVPIRQAEFWPARLTILAYLPVLFNGGFIWDDDRYVVNNPALRSVSGLFHIWTRIGETTQYYPLTFTTFWIELRLWGVHPLGYHFVNVALHAANAVLLLRVLRYLGLGPAALVAATLFAVHPVEVESVAWISERKNVLSTFFYLLSASAYLRWLDLKPRTWQLYVQALLLFLAALFSKTVSCSLPAALLLVLWWKQRLRWREVLWLSPMFAAGLVLSRITAWLEVWSVGASGPEWDLSFGDRVIVAGRAIWFYAGKLFWPHPLIFSYPRWSIDDHDPWQYVPAAAVVCVVLVAFLLGRQIGRGPVTALLFFVGTLFPALGFVNVYPMQFSFVADHFQYLASAGLLTLFAAALVRLPGPMLKLPTSFEGIEVSRSACCVTAALVLALCAMTFQQSRIYCSAESIWRDTLKKNDRSWLAAVNLGLVEKRAGHTDKAFDLFQKALSIKPDNSVIHLELGNVYGEMGDFGPAESHYRDSIRLRPDNSVALRNLAQLLVLRGEAEKGLLNAREAVRLKPDWADAHATLGQALEAVGNREEAAVEFSEARRITDAQ